MADDDFEAAAEAAALAKLNAFSELTLDAINRLPGAAAEDIVVAGKEVQLTVFRQQGLPDDPEAVLVTAQVSRASLGGMVTFLLEKGRVFSASGSSRPATDEELAATAG